MHEKLMSGIDDLAELADGVAVTDRLQTDGVLFQTADSVSVLMDIAGRYHDAPLAKPRRHIEDCRSGGAIRPADPVTV